MARKKQTPHGLLRSCRKAIGLSQQELGDLLGVSRNTIRSWEIGKEPRFLLLLCKGLKAHYVLPHIGVELSGGCLSALRSRLGFHQEQLAEQLGVSRPTLSRWENDTPPRWVSFAVTALAFKD
ncbi:helix-turn-helix domain-containing protein [Pseudomonas putida]|uniref:helix-turn-helix domain-containing protein n=1 Tax=Pseudomonas putida TaxID=303 RepID=UPI0032FF812A|nr:helix-turn-helix transcriptional regulator [Pseudomonas putida]